jgi:hypothetical protein
VRFKQVILSSATVASIMLTASLINPSVFSVISEAQSASNVSVDVSFGTFYDRLAPYGSWVSYQDGYVWLPEHVNTHWRPYTEGHWSFTRRYGWLWVSDERFGWATYHYGRWGYARDIGWYWVPGRRWAPAWVAWSHAGRDIAWAPLPPRYNDEVNVTISFGDIPDYYWQAVPTSAFLSINLSSKISDDRDYVRTVVQSSPPQTVIIQNNIVVNNVIEVGLVEKETKTKVIVLEEKPVNSPDAIGKTDGKTVTIFNPDVKVEASAKPAAIKKVEDVAKDRVAKGVPPLDTTVVTSKAPAKATDGTTPPAAKVNTPVVDPNAAKTDNKAPKATDGTALPTAKTDAPAVDLNTPKIDKKAPAKATDGTTPPAAKVETPVVDPNKPKTDNKAPVKATDGTTPPAAKAGASVVDQNAPKTEKSTKPVETQPVQPKAKSQKTDQQNGEQPKAEKKKPEAGRKAKACDPAVEDCQPAQ